MVDKVDQIAAEPLCAEIDGIMHTGTLYVRGTDKQSFDIEYNGFVIFGLGRQYDTDEASQSEMRLLAR